MVVPRWLGYDEKLDDKFVTVKIMDAPDTRSQVIAGIGDKKVEAKVPDMALHNEDGSTTIMLDKLTDPENAKAFANKFAVVEKAQIQRVLGDDVVTIGSSPDDEIFVHIPADARPSNNEDWGPQVEAKARLNVSGYLKPMPPLERAKELLRLKDVRLENKPLPPLYLEAKSIRVVENKPMPGDE